MKGIRMARLLRIAARTPSASAAMLKPPDSGRSEKLSKNSEGWQIGADLWLQRAVCAQRLY